MPSQVAPTGPAFSQCTACSPPVLEALETQGWLFFFLDPAHNHFIWLGVDLLYIFYIQGWELICYIFAVYIFYIQGWELMKKVGEDPSHLEDLTGLTALMQVRQIVSPIMLLKENKNIDQMNFQDTSLMEGVIDLADDDCISFSSSCDWTVVSKMSHAYPSKIFLFILSKQTLLNAVFLAYCDMIFDMRLWTNCTEARLTIVWPLLDRRPCAKSIQKVFSLPCNDLSAMT